MNDISLIKELGLNEVSRRTHIEAEHLGYIADKNFEKLVRLNVKGFIKNFRARAKYRLFTMDERV